MDPRWRQLHDLAMRQHGHIATRQVEEAGLTRPALHYQVRAGLLEPVARGVYRFTTFPPGDREREAAVMLWAGVDRGIAAAVRAYVDGLGSVRRADLIDRLTRLVERVRGALRRRDRVRLLELRTKTAGEAGLELADLVVSPIGRHVIGKPPHEDWVIVAEWLRRCEGSRRGAGLVVVPR